VKSAQTSIIAGIVLIAVGVLLLLDLRGVIESAAYVPALIFAAVGAVFVSLFIRSRENWWAAIPGSVFLGLAAVITATQLTGGGAGAAFLFLFMGAGFAAVYLRERANWWALIPSGVMLTLAFIVALPQDLQGTTVAAVLFLGLAATFGLLSVVPVRTSDHTGRMKWPLIPAAVLAVLGAIFSLQATALLISAEFAVPAVMILAGIALLIYAYRAHRAGQHKARGPGTGGL
jgi:drug/metabolite transporter (DMT)-like permease